MSIIHTERNMVAAHEPEPGDKFVRVVWHGPDPDGRHMRAFEGPLWPIEEWQSTVDWAVSMADFMRSPMYVETFNAGDARKVRKETVQ